MADIPKAKALFAETEELGPIAIALEILVLDTMAVFPIAMLFEPDAIEEIELNPAEDPIVIELFPVEFAAGPIVTALV